MAYWRIKCRCMNVRCKYHDQLQVVKVEVQSMSAVPMPARVVCGNCAWEMKVQGNGGRSKSAGGMKGEGQ